MARTLLAAAVVSVGGRQVRVEPVGFAEHGRRCERKREAEVHGKDPPRRVAAPPVVHGNVGEKSGVTWE